MLDAFSTRARQVVFAARFKAGERGAEAISVDDFLLGLVLEDQGMLGDMFWSAFDYWHLWVTREPCNFRGHLH
jgi:hypothetical protein